MTAPRSKARSKATPTKAEREKREKAIVVDLKAGKLSYRQIAQKHGVSLPTVNNKARKFGISRGRRPGAKILVAMPPRRKKTSKKAAGATARKTAGRTARRATAAKTPPKARVVRGRASGSFQEAFRELVLHHYPNISLKAFDRLTHAVEKELS